MADVKDEEQREEGEEAQKQLSMNECRINTQPFGISVQVIWRSVVLKSNDNCTPENKESMCEWQSRGKKIRQVTCTLAWGRWGLNSYCNTCMLWSLCDNFKMMSKMIHAYTSIKADKKSREEGWKYDVFTDFLLNVVWKGGWMMSTLVAFFFMMRWARTWQLSTVFFFYLKKTNTKCPQPHQVHHKMIYCAPKDKTKE